jgi:hypothetical protein
MLHLLLRPNQQPLPRPMLHLLLRPNQQPLPRPLRQSTGVK